MERLILQSVLPWADCNNDWNTDKCWDNYTEAALPNVPNNSVSPSQEFYEYVSTLSLLSQTTQFLSIGIRKS